jgi:hypothetical protein
VRTNGLAGSDVTGIMIKAAECNSAIPGVLGFSEIA